MSGVVTGFSIIAAIVFVGYVVGRSGLLGDHADYVISRLVFYVLSPFLLVTVLAEAEVERLFSPLIVISALAAVVTGGLFALVALLLWRRRVPEATVGAMAAGYVNSNNIGIPVAVYVLGDATYAAPVVLMQLLVLTPALLMVLDTSTGGRTSLRRALLQPLRNPIIIGSALGFVISVSGITVPGPVMEPFQLIGAAAVPVILINYGMSLSGSRLLQPGTGRRDVLLASGLKLVVMPVVAWLLGRFAFGLDGMELFAVVTLAALPTAQNIFNYAQLYGRGVIVARDTILITTVGSAGVLVAVSALLH